MILFAFRDLIVASIFWKAIIIVMISSTNCYSIYLISSEELIVFVYMMTNLLINHLDFVTTMIHDFMHLLVHCSLLSIGRERSHIVCIFSLTFQVKSILCIKEEIALYYCFIIRAIFQKKVCALNFVILFSFS